MKKSVMPEEVRKKISELEAEKKKLLGDVERWEAEKELEVADRAIDGKLRGLSIELTTEFVRSAEKIYDDMIESARESISAIDKELAELQKSA